MNVRIIVIIILITILIFFNRQKVINVTRRISMSNEVFPGSNFQWWELTQTSQPYPNIPNEQERENLVLLTEKLLQPIRNMFGPTSLSSAFRSELVNNAVGGAKNSQHRLGFAADITRTGNTQLSQAFELIKNSTLPYDQLIYETGTPNNKKAEWIHISYDPKGGRKQAMIAPYDYKKNQRNYINVT